MARLSDHVNIYNTDVPGLNETKGIVDQGNRVVVHFYNIEALSGDKHSFTIDAPYNVDIDVHPVRIEPPRS